MTHKFRVLLVGLMLAGCAMPSGPTAPVNDGARAPTGQAATDAPVRQISVTGEAQVRVAPDEVVLVLGVETWDKDLLTAKWQNDERIKKLLGLGKTFGIDVKYIQTDQINIEPRYRNEYENRELVAYFVQKTVVFTLKDTSKFEGLLTAVLEAGTTHVHDVQFRTTELRKYRDQARSLAIKAAREKAVALTQELGEKVGEPMTISEGQIGWWSWYNSGWSRGGGPMTQNVIQEVGPGPSLSEDGSIALGQISVNASVSVSFALD
jgi:uncharacterized protein YggE